MHRSEITIDIGALRRNARTLLQTLDGAELWAVVKANAYGHGAADAAADQRQDFEFVWSKLGLAPLRSKPDDRFVLAGELTARRDPEIAGRAGHIGGGESQLASCSRPHKLEFGAGGQVARLES